MSSQASKVRAKLEKERNPTKIYSHVNMLEKNPLLFKTQLKFIYDCFTYVSYASVSSPSMVGH